MNYLRQLARPTFELQINLSLRNANLDNQMSLCEEVLKAIAAEVKYLLKYSSRSRLFLLLLLDCDLEWIFFFVISSIFTKSTHTRVRNCLTTTSVVQLLAVVEPTLETETNVLFRVSLSSLMRWRLDWTWVWIYHSIVSRIMTRELLNLLVEASDDASNINIHFKRRPNTIKHRKRKKYK